MNIVDFGKNTYQFQAQFRFNILDTNLIRGIVDELLLAKKYFSTVSTDGDTDDTTLNVGDGTPQHPFLHLRLSPNRLLLWGGWHHSYDSWQSWRSDMIATLEPHLKGVSPPYVAHLLNQHSLAIPTDRLKLFLQVPQMEPMVGLLRQFVPEPLLHAVGSQVALSDKDERDQMGWWTGGTQPGEQSLNVAVQRNVVRDEDGSVNMWPEFLAMSDQLLLGFHEHYLSLFISKDGSGEAE